MKPDLITSSAKTLLKHYLMPSSVAKVSMVRDEGDNYVIDIRVTQEDKMCSIPTKSDILPLIPASSQCSHAIEWHSYFGIPLQTKSQLWLALGLETICKHETRGAYPTFECYLFPYEEPPVVALQALAAAITPAGNHISAKKFLEATSVIPVSEALSSEHKKIEAAVINLAASGYASMRKILFFTLILSEGQLVLNGYPGPKYNANAAKHTPAVIWDQSILVYDKPSLTSFTRSSKTWLISRRNIF